MRIIIDSLIGVMLIAVVAGGLYLYNSRQQRDRQIETVRSALQQLQEQAAYHSTVQSAMAGQDTLLVHLHPQWFGEDLPTNVLLSEEHPWIDLAPPGDLGHHPPNPVVSSSEPAGFWYNPTTGIFRARVTPQSSEAQTLALYNTVNGTSLSAFEELPDPSRRPIAHVLGTTPARQYASMANKSWSEMQPKKELASDLIVAQPKAQSQPDTAQASPEHAATLADQFTGQTDDLSHQGDSAPLVEVMDEPIRRPTLNKE